MTEGNRNFIRLAVTVGDWAALKRIRSGIHPFRNEHIRREDWPWPDEVAA